MTQRLRRAVLHYVIQTGNFSVQRTLLASNKVFNYCLV